MKETIAQPKSYHSPNRATATDAAVGCGPQLAPPLALVCNPGASTRFLPLIATESLVAAAATTTTH